MSGSTQEKSPISPDSKSKEYLVMLASDMDFAEVARRSGGSLHYGADPSITWPSRGNDAPSLFWRNEYDLQRSTNEKTLVLWRYGWGGGGMEDSGVVMGEDFVAFVHPISPSGLGYLYAEVISQGEIEEVILPEGIFHPSFLEARELSRNVVREILVTRETTTKGS